MENNVTSGPPPAVPGSYQTQPAGEPPAGEPPGPPKRRRYRYRSLFWPLIIIGAGVIWLLYGLGAFSAANLAVIGLVWPVFVIAIGVDLLLGHRSLIAGAAVGVVTLAIIIVLMSIGPSQGWVGSTELKTETFSTPVGTATAAQIELGLSGYTASVHALPEGSAGQLIAATVTHRGTMRFLAEGTTTKNVELRSSDGWQWWQRIGSDTETPWDIGLARGIPLELIVLASSGSNTIDLTGMQIRKLEVDASSGDSQIVLPAGDTLSATLPDIDLHSSSGRMEVQVPGSSAFAMDVDMSSGDTRVTIGRDTSADIRFRGSSGQFLLIVKSGQALRVEVRQVSSGDVKLPDGLVRVSGSDDEGVWETPGYDSAANGVDLVIESMSSGTVRVQVED